MKKRRNNDAGFNDRLALDEVKGERTVSELPAEYGVQQRTGQRHGQLIAVRNTEKPKWPQGRQQVRHPFELRRQPGGIEDRAHPVR